MSEGRRQKEQYAKWKQMIPFLYDWFSNHQLTWPSLSCRWGPVIEDKSFMRKQLLYLSEQTDGTEPNKLLVMTAVVAKPRVASAETVTGFNEAHKSPYIKPHLTIFHPGEVNKIRECRSHPSILVTHSDAPELYVWGTDSQPDRSQDKGSGKAKLSKPDLVLAGHEANAEFALGVAGPRPLVASGGKDTNVLVWDLEDHVGGLTGRREPTASSSGAASTSLAARDKLQGHSNTVEDVVWQPGSDCELASVGDDYQLLLWDTRAGSGAGPAARVADAHGPHDLHCVDWSALQTHLLATGSADGSLRIWDRRRLGGGGADPAAALFTFRQHTAPIMRVEWGGSRQGVLASGGDDKLVNVWDLEMAARGATAAGGGDPKHTAGSVPPQLLFQHCGHRSSVVDFHWNPADEWTLLSISDDANTEAGGGTLQMWRISDLIYRPEEEALKELEEHREFMITGKQPAKPAAAAAKAASADAAAGPVPASNAAAGDGKTEVGTSTQKGGQTGAELQEVNGVEDVAPMETDA